MLDSQSEEQLRMITSGQQHWQTTCYSIRNSSRFFTTHKQKNLFNKKKKMMIDLDIINDSVPLDHWKRTFFPAMPF